MVQARRSQHDWHMFQNSRGNTDTDEDGAKSGTSSLVGEHLFAARTVLLFGEVNMSLAERVSAQLFALAEQSDEPIRLILHSPGGHVESADTIHDVIQFIRPRVRILGTGWVASAGALIFSAAALEDRCALPNTRFLLHQPLGGVSGPTSDVEIEARQILRMRQRLNLLLAKATGQSLDKITADTERNHWMNADEALRYGLLGTVLTGAGELV
jgi:ATP-dependent Clp protease, protease subunit